MISIVVAHGSNRVIGRDGGMPWHLPADLKRFRELTIGGAVVMGRKTFESLPPAYRPLPNRRNLVLSSDPDYTAERAEVLPSFQSALEACRLDCFVIGGGAIYAQALPHSSRIYATEIDDPFDGDTFFPELEESDWRCVERSRAMAENGYSFTFKVYERQDG